MATPIIRQVVNADKLGKTCKFLKTCHQSIRYSVNAKLCGVLSYRLMPRSKIAHIFGSILLSSGYITTTSRSSSSDSVGSATKKLPGIKADSDLGTKEKSFEPNDPRLRSHECLKNAAGLSVDSTSAVLSQAVYALTTTEEKYAELVEVLVVLMEYQLQVLGHEAEYERIGDLIMEARHEILKIKQKKEDLQLLFSSVEKLADAAAEVAFAAGADYASTCAGERLYSAQQEVCRVQTRSEEADSRLREAQVKSVEVLTQHEERQRQQAEKEAAESADADESNERGEPTDVADRLENKKPEASEQRNEEEEKAWKDR